MIDFNYFIIQCSISWIIITILYVLQIKQSELIKYHYKAPKLGQFKEPVKVRVKHYDKTGEHTGDSYFLAYAYTEKYGFMLFNSSECIPMDTNVSWKF